MIHMATLIAVLVSDTKQESANAHLSAFTFRQEFIMGLGRQ
jgi:hypothetical protein